MVKNFQLHFSHTYLLTPNGNGKHTEQDAYGIKVTKWNYYLQRSDIVVCNDPKPLQKFVNGKNANKIYRWSLELATYNITFEWISGAHNKAADCLSQLVDVKDTPATPTASIKEVDHN